MSAPVASMSEYQGASLEEDSVSSSSASNNNNNNGSTGNPLFDNPDNYEAAFNEFDRIRDHGAAPTGNWRDFNFRAGRNDSGFASGQQNDNDDYPVRVWASQANDRAMINGDIGKALDPRLNYHGNQEDMDEDTIFASESFCLRTRTHDFGNAILSQQAFEEAASQSRPLAFQEFGDPILPNNQVQALQKNHFPVTAESEAEHEMWFMSQVRPAPAHNHPEAANPWACDRILIRLDSLHHKLMALDRKWRGDYLSREQCRRRFPDRNYYDKKDQWQTEEEWKVVNQIHAAHNQYIDLGGDVTLLRIRTQRTYAVESD